MQQDYRKLTLDMQRRAAEMARVIQRDVPAYIAVAWERMKDANFSAQGFVRGGSAVPRWDKRKKETPRSSGKRILHSTGTLQASVHFTPGAGDWCRRTKIPAAWENRPAGVTRPRSPMHASTTRAAESPSTCGLSPDDWCRRTEMPAAWENRPAGVTRWPGSSAAPPIPAVSTWASRPTSSFPPTRISPTPSAGH